MTQTERDWKNTRVYIIANGWQSAKESRRMAAKSRGRICRRSLFHCEICTWYDPTHGDLLKVHHIVPVEKGGHGYGSNLIAICSNCHTAVHEFAHPKFRTQGQLFSRMSFDDQVEAVIRYGYDKESAERMVLFASQNVYVAKREIFEYSKDEKLRQGRHSFTSLTECNANVGD